MALSELVNFHFTMSARTRFFCLLLCFPQHTDFFFRFQIMTRWLSLFRLTHLDTMMSKERRWLYVSLFISEKLSLEFPQQIPYYSSLARISSYPYPKSVTGKRNGITMTNTKAYGSVEGDGSL